MIEWAQPLRPGFSTRDFQVVREGEVIADGIVWGHTGEVDFDFRLEYHGQFSWSLTVDELSELVDCSKTLRHIGDME